MQYPQPPQGYPQPQKTSGSSVLVIVAVAVVGLVFFIGILAVLAISGVRKYLQNAKMAEALNGVGAIGRSAASSYDPTSGPLCASASAPIPASLSMVSGKKYMSSPTDWAKDTATNAGFACLKFEMSYPQYYQYDYKRLGSGLKTGDTFLAIAHGDLDDDGKASTFDLTGTIDARGTVEINPTIAQTDPTE